MNLSATQQVEFLEYLKKQYEENMAGCQKGTEEFLWRENLYFAAGTILAAMTKELHTQNLLDSCRGAILNNNYLDSRKDKQFFKLGVRND